MPWYVTDNFDLQVDLIKYVFLLLGAGDGGVGAMVFIILISQCFSF